MEAAIVQRIRNSFGRQAVMAAPMAAITTVENGAVTIELPFRSDLTQQHGFIHAGVVTMIVDSACGYAALTTMPAATAVLTAEYKVNFLAPAAGEQLIARGRVLKPGRTVTVCFGEVHAQKDGKEKLVATMLATKIARQETGLTD